MSSSEAASSGASPRAPHAHGHHFSSAAQEQRAAHLGMWLFLVSEMLLFGGVFACYALYRVSYPEAFALASKMLNPLMGTLNTVVLITSSFTVALAVHFAKASRGKLCAAMLGLSLVLALGFLGVKGSEYAHHIHEGALPGALYTFKGLDLPGASLFFTFYFFSTGLHAIHVLAGMTVLGVMAFRSWRGAFSRAYFTPVELSAMYWHLVDLVWIFLFPLLYLI